MPYDLSAILEHIHSAEVVPKSYGNCREH
jgi:hypothetical protein